MTSLLAKKRIGLASQTTFGACLFSPTHPFFCSRFFANGNPFLTWPSLSLWSEPGGKYSLTLPWLPHFGVKNWPSSEPRIYGTAVQTQETSETERNPYFPARSPRPGEGYGIQGGGGRRGDPGGSGFSHAGPAGFCFNVFCRTVID